MPLILLSESWQNDPLPQSLVTNWFVDGCVGLTWCWLIGHFRPVLYLSFRMCCQKTQQGNLEPSNNGKLAVWVRTKNIRQLILFFSRLCLTFPTPPGTVGKSHFCSKLVNKHLKHGIIGSVELKNWSIICAGDFQIWKMGWTLSTEREREREGGGGQRFEKDEQNQVLEQRSSEWTARHPEHWAGVCSPAKAVSASLFRQIFHFGRTFKPAASSPLQDLQCHQRGVFWPNSESLLQGLHPVHNAREFGLHRVQHSSRSHQATILRWNGCVFWKNILCGQKPHCISWSGEAKESIYGELQWPGHFQRSNGWLQEVDSNGELAELFWAWTAAVQWRRWMQHHRWYPTNWRGWQLW